VRRIEDAMMDKISLSEKFDLVTEYWSPRVVGDLNGQHVKIAKFKGEFIWHRHDAEDEMFLVVKGRLAIHLRDRIVELSEGDMFVVPRGVEHKPIADEEVHALLFEPASTVNTGNVRNEKTIDNPERI
jgi:mannose-6-phosphate isomerase-like protein (cupin superfamily)